MRQSNGKTAINFVGGRSAANAEDSLISNAGIPPRPKLRVSYARTFRKMKLRIRKERNADGRNEGSVGERFHDLLTSPRNDQTSRAEMDYSESRFAQEKWQGSVGIQFCN